MKAVYRNSFDSINMYKLYRTVSEIIHPTISKKNISNYKIILKDDLAPLRIFYPKKVSALKSVIIFIHGENFFDENFLYSNVCNEIATLCDRLVIGLDYKNFSSYKFPISLDECYQTVKYLYKELNNVGINDNNITLMGDSFGASIINGIILKSIEDEFNIKKQILISPILDNNTNTFDNKLDIILKNNIEKLFKKYINNKKDLDNPMIIPMKNTDYKYYPNTYMVAGATDPLISTINTYFEILKDNKVKANILTLPFAEHNFLGVLDDENKEEFYKGINVFLKK